MDKDGFGDKIIERCRFCGGPVTKKEVIKGKGSFGSSPGSQKRHINVCSRTGRTLEQNDIVLTSSQEILGWPPISVIC